MPGMKESDFENSLLRAAQVLGYQRHAERPAMRQSGTWSTPIKGERGWPDLFLVGYGVAFALELKSEKGRVGPGQQEWVDALDAVPGITARIVRPSDHADVLDMLKAPRAASFRPIRNIETTP